MIDFLCEWSIDGLMDWWVDELRYFLALLKCLLIAVTQPALVQQSARGRKLRIDGTGGGGERITGTQKKRSNYPKAKRGLPWGNHTKKERNKGGREEGIKQKGKRSWTSDKVLERKPRRWNKHKWYVYIYICIFERFKELHSMPGIEFGENSGSMHYRCYHESGVSGKVPSHIQKIFLSENWSKR